MVIEVCDGWRITSNVHCWQVERLKGVDKNGEERWRPETYHVDFEGALGELANRRVRLIKSSVPGEILEAIAMIREDVRRVSEVFSIGGERCVD